MKFCWEIVFKLFDRENIQKIMSYHEEFEPSIEKFVRQRYFSKSNQIPFFYDIYRFCPINSSPTRWRTLSKRFYSSKTTKE